MSTPKTPKKKVNKTNGKRNYNINPADKIAQGLPWTLHFDIDPDVAKKLIGEKQKNGAEYGKLINAACRKAYRLPKLKE